MSNAGDSFSAVFITLKISLKTFVSLRKYFSEYLLVLWRNRQNNKSKKYESLPKLSVGARFQSRDWRPLAAAYQPARFQKYFKNSNAILFPVLSCEHQYQLKLGPSSITLHSTLNEYVE